MAKLILEEGEKGTCIEALSCETIGKVMKKAMFSFEASDAAERVAEKDLDPWYIKLGLIMWASKLNGMNATEAHARLDGVTEGDVRLGDWELTLRRVDDGEMAAPGISADPTQNRRGVELTIQADNMTPGTRLTSAWSLLASALRCLFLGSMYLRVTKEMRITEMGVSRGPETPREAQA